MTEKDFWLILERDPGDVETRRVFADWLEEHDQLNLAKAMRYQVEHRRRTQYLRWIGVREYEDPSSMTGPCRLPWLIWIYLNQGVFVQETFLEWPYHKYSSSKEADLDLAQAPWNSGVLQ